MKKIENVIDSCTDCRHCRRYGWLGSNTDFLVVCYYDTEGVKINPFILEDTSRKDIHKIDIPNNCPLETYVSKRPLE